MAQTLASVVERLTTPVALAWLLLIGAAGTLAGAHALETFAGLPPCPLCLRQRIPYWGAIPLAGLTVVAVSLNTRPSRLVSAAGFAGLAVVFVVSAGLAVQHIGVEEKWWVAACVSEPTGSIDDLIAGMGTQNIVRCDEKTPFLFGLTLAAYNLLVSLGLAGLAGLGLAKTVRTAGPGRTGGQTNDDSPIPTPAPTAQGTAPGRADDKDPA